MAKISRRKSTRIADIYVRVASRSAEQGLLRQEEVCREWCKKEGIEVRHVIKDIGRAFGVNKRAAPAFNQAIDGWRKKYWEDKGEPLTDDECDPGVVPISPPNFIVMERVDRLCTTGVVKGMFLVKLMESIGVRIAAMDVLSSEMSATATTSGPMTYHDPEGIGVRVNADGSMIFARSELLTR